MKDKAIDEMNGARERDTLAVLVCGPLFKVMRLDGVVPKAIIEPEKTPDGERTGDSLSDPSMDVHFERAGCWAEGQPVYHYVADVKHVFKLRHEEFALFSENIPFFWNEVARLREKCNDLAGIIDKQEMKIEEMERRRDGNDST